MSEIDWSHRESLRMWAQLAARGHEGAQAVATYHGLTPPAVLPPIPTQRPTPAPASVSAVVPRAPRAAVQPTPALAGITRRAGMLSSLLGAQPAAPTDLV
jgi:hypothetical protein